MTNTETQAPIAAGAHQATTPPAAKALRKPAAKAAKKAATKAPVVQKTPAAKTAPAKPKTKASAPKATPAKTPSKIPAKPAKAKVDKVAKAKKIKAVRDSFTFPKDEYSVLEVLKSRAAKLAIPAKKTEVLRAAIKVLASLSDSAFATAIRSVPSLKTGRPAKG